MINKLYINTTYACNIDCPRCYISEHERQNFSSRLDVGYLEQIIKETTFDINNLVVMYMGGETTILAKSEFITYIETVRSLLPNVKHTMVTNLFKWTKHIEDITCKYFNNQIETTYALGAKQTLSGEEDRYQDVFIQNLKHITDKGIDCTVNVELNKETYNKGVESIIKIMQLTHTKSWAFDYSLDFANYDNNTVDEYGYPVIPGTISLRQFHEFVHNVRSHEFVQNNNIKIFNVDEAFSPLLDDQQYLTINPNNTVTTNPIFSDVSLLCHKSNKALSFSLMLQNHRKRNLSRIKEIRCVACCNFRTCQGFSSHVPIIEDGVCAGGKDMEINALHRVHREEYV